MIFSVIPLAQLLPTVKELKHDPNPYASPAPLSNFVPSTEPRSIGRPIIFITGGLIGCVSFALSMALIPADTPNPTTHDLRLANNLGLIFPPLVGTWASWVRNSTAWAVFGVTRGLCIGAIYYLLCGTNFLADMVGFPCILGVATNVLLGTRHHSWIDGISQRVNGLVAGFTFGLSYMIVLNAPFFSTIQHPSFTTSQHSQGMWIAGTIAMTISSAIYFVVFYWSAGLDDPPLVDGADAG